MLWAIKTKNSQAVNFDHYQTKAIIQQKQSPQTSSDSINLCKKQPIKKSLQQLIHQVSNYEPISKYLDKNKLLNSNYLQTKRYRQCIYFGQIKQNKRQGLGVMLYTNGRIYEGQWADNFKSGNGYQKFANLSLYQGAYQKGKPHGYGKYEWENGQVYQGQWIDGLKNGSGIWRGSKGDSYIGQWKNGKADGYGVHTWINGNRYQGQFKQCLKHGQGVDKFRNGDMYRGAYQNGKPHGYGQYFWANGSSYKGQFFDGLRNGKGIWRKSNQLNCDTYDGYFKDQKKQGHGVFIWANGSKYIGDFKNDLRQGYGCMYWADGNQYKGQWRNGQQVQQITNPDLDNFNLDPNYLSKQLSHMQLQNNQQIQDRQYHNPQDFYQFQQFQQPNHPQIYQIKKFRARGMTSRVKSTKYQNLKLQNPKIQNSKVKVGNGLMVCNNFVTQALHSNNYMNSSSPKNKLQKRPSRLSFNGGKLTSSSSNNSKCKIRHSQSTSQKKAMTAQFYNYDNRSSSNKIPIKNFQGVEFRQNTSQHYQGSNLSKSNINKIKPRVIKSSNGVRNIYNRNNQEMNMFWQEMQNSRNAILNNENLDDSAKWFTRSKNKSQYF